MPVVPLGLINAEATLQRLLNQVLNGLQSFARPTVDDTAVFSNTWAVKGSEQQDQS